MPSKRKHSGEQVDTGGKKLRQTTLTAPKSDSLFNSSWAISGSLVTFNCPESKPSSKVLALDMDGTIITTASGKVFAKNVNDWKLVSDEIPKILKQYVSNGYKLIIMSNQSGVTKGHLSISDLQKKVENILLKLKVPIQCYFSIAVDRCRKPSTGMWDEFEKHGNNGVKVDRSASFYCGDAAGRPAIGSRKKDHSCCDRLFAINLGVPFLTPEQLWLKKADPEPYTLPVFDPRVFLNSDEQQGNNKHVAFVKPEHNELIVMVGFPGSGKSHFCRTILEPLGYTIINRDTLGTWQKCVQMCQEAFAQNKSVAVDNTNLDIESRARFINLAKQKKIPVRCIVMQTSVEHCRHHERFRSITDPKHVTVSQMVFNMLKSKFVHPVKKEGFAEIIEVPFSFDSKIENRDLYCQFLLEK